MIDDPDLSAALSRLQPHYAPTPLLDLPPLARRAGVAQVLVKDESKRPLGNFKSLGGVYAGLRALARAAGAADVEALLSGEFEDLPALITASDGNHGLSVATAARLSGSAARIYLPASVPDARVRRITGQGAEVIKVDGTYDEAVDAAAAAAARGEGLLIADTSADLDNLAVRDVMAGYGLIARELTAQLSDAQVRPSHVFVQSGVGGLAAAMADGLASALAPGGRLVAVDPAAAACTMAALAAGRPVPVSGDLHTSAEMLACGLASAPAVATLLRHRAMGVAAREEELAQAVLAMAEAGGPATTPSGAAGLAGLLMAVQAPDHGQALGLDSSSRVLLIVTEGPVPTES